MSARKAARSSLFPGPARSVQTRAGPIQGSPDAERPSHAANDAPARAGVRGPDRRPRRRRGLPAVPAPLCRGHARIDLPADDPGRARRSPTRPRRRNPAPGRDAPGRRPDRPTRPRRSARDPARRARPDVAAVEPDPADRRGAEEGRGRDRPRRRRRPTPASPSRSEPTAAPEAADVPVELPPAVEPTRSPRAAAAPSNRDRGDPAGDPKRSSRPRPARDGRPSRSKTPKPDPWPTPTADAEPKPIDPEKPAAACATSGATAWPRSAGSRRGGPASRATRRRRGRSGRGCSTGWPAKGRSRRARPAGSGTASSPPSPRPPAPRPPTSRPSPITSARRSTPWSRTPRSRSPRLSFCRKIDGFGHYDPVDAPSVRTGQPLLVYCEMAGLRYESDDDRLPVAALVAGRGAPGRRGRGRLVGSARDGRGRLPAPPPRLLRELPDRRPRQARARLVRAPALADRPGLQPLGLGHRAVLRQAVTPSPQAKNGT